MYTYYKMYVNIHLRIFVFPLCLSVPFFKEPSQVWLETRESFIRDECRLCGLQLTEKHIAGFPCPKSNSTIIGSDERKEERKKIFDDCETEADGTLTSMREPPEFAGNGSDIPGNPQTAALGSAVFGASSPRWSILYADGAFSTLPRKVPICYYVLEGDQGGEKRAREQGDKLGLKLGS